MASACALAIFSGRIIYNFAILENLRIFQNCLFTGGVVKANGIYNAASSGRNGKQLPFIFTTPLVKKCSRNARRRFWNTNIKIKFR